MTASEYKLHQTMASQLLLLDFDCFLQLYFSSPSRLTASFSGPEKRQLARKLLTKNLQMISLNLHAKHGFKLIDALWHDHPPAANEFMTILFNNLAGLDPVKRNALLHIILSGIGAGLLAVAGVRAVE